MNQNSAIPKDAAAVILLDQDESKVLWAQRNPRISFLGGFHAFPGGKVDETDIQITIKNCAEHKIARFIACAARELFEEIGVLLVRNGEKLTKGQRASLHDDLISGRSLFGEILADWNLWIDAEDFFYTGCWTTPQFSPVRFKTRFFIAKCPPKQVPYQAITEMQNIEFITPDLALACWANSEVLISPPVLISMRELAEFERQRRGDADKVENKFSASLRLCGEKLRRKSQECGGGINYIELNPHLICFPLKTETLPPATHTNCFIVGRKEFVVIDAAAKDESEQKKLFQLTDSFIHRGFSCKEIIVSHLHKDHFGGETAVQNHFLEKFNLEVPISAHRITAESLSGKVRFQKFIEADETIKLEDEKGADVTIKALHMPGHARGHLCFYDQERGFLLTSDNIVGTGSVIIAPPEGDMADYLNSLERMRNLPNLRHLCGSHGAAVFDAKGKIENYIAHRLGREKQILEAFQNGSKTPAEIAEVVYHNLNPELFSLAAKSVSAHLAKLKQDGLI